MTVLNLRSLAGGRILRGSQPFGLDAVSAAGFLAAHGIQTVMDLRSEYERAMVPWPIPNGMPDGGSDAGRAAAVELVENPFDPHTATGGLQSIETPQDLGELYLGWVRARPDWVADALRPVAQGRRTLIHCSLGKDRTGVVSALALLLAGEHPDAVVADYTATAANLPEMLHVMADTWRLHVPSTPSQYFSPDLMILQAPEAAMRHFLAGFAREFGSPAAYLRDAGLSAVELDILSGKAH
ncbi:tyrosine-protein phosphatase [Arthrobacter sp. CJ23]|uniref:tyrosine-protein phosphatase n=1 Tax=Arthrobacter sp. CJ23 TaxID=2972479 RepID=UPI00215D15C3|nr:tyrosine-protein phosphatase [Arthrobacter sp. CJ23]UVJ40061.1 tyrosine-protein phosphatase [Arthrobacter sp. CJ23]